VKIQDFIKFDSFKIIFPEFQDKEIIKLAHNIKKYLGNDANLTQKASYEYKKLSLKDKDILYIELKNSKKGFFGLLLFLYLFEELIEIHCIKKIHFFEVPKELRELKDDYINLFETTYNKLTINKIINELKLVDIDINLLVKIKNLIRNKK